MAAPDPYQQWPIPFNVTIPRAGNRTCEEILLALAGAFDPDLIGIGVPQPVASCIDPYRPVYPFTSSFAPLCISPFLLQTKDG